MADQVIVLEYNPKWAIEYEQEKEKVQHALHDISIGIEHIGSTAVPGLGAKPIIDFMVGIENLDTIKQKHIDGLSKIDYVYVPNEEFPTRRFFRKGQWRAGTHHLHIYKYNGDEWRNNILFRDYLKKYPEYLIEYYELKKQLEEKYKHDRKLYTEAKSPFIQGTIMKALEELKK